ncbi:MAG: hypothetical protein IPN62_11785 [Flavobacteriales bacterium]|nr:hypothetical protein [Flavobacteriales bacterium]
MTMQAHPCTRWNWLIWLAAITLLGYSYGCGVFHKGMDKEMIGEYAFQFPSGGIEVLELRKDSTYQHMFYETVASYRTGKEPFYPSAGTWEYNGERFVFDRWQSFAPSGNPVSLVLPPLQDGSLLLHGQIWYPAKGGRPAYLVYDRDYDYIFLKVDDRSEVFK